MKYNTPNKHITRRVVRITESQQCITPIVLILRRAVRSVRPYRSFSGRAGSSSESLYDYKYYIIIVFRTVLITVLMFHDKYCAVEQLTISELLRREPIIRYSIIKL